MVTSRSSLVFLDDSMAMYVVNFADGGTAPVAVACYSWNEEKLLGKVNCGRRSLR